MTNALRILLVNSFADAGGAQFATLRLARGLRDRGHDVTVLFLYERAPVGPSDDHPYEILLPKRAPGLLDHLRIAGRLSRRIRREKPDVVLSFLPLANIVAQAAAWMSGINGRIVSHRVPLSTTNTLLRHLDGVWARLGFYTHVVAVSEGVRATCLHYPAWLRSRLVVVHNGIRGWRPSTLTRETARLRFGVTDERLLLVAIGRLAPQKNYPFLLQVMQRVENAILLIAGEGPLRAELETMAAEMKVREKVRFLGLVERADIPDLLAAADVFVQPSIFEGQSNAVLEALQAGTPVVANDIPEQRETIADPDGATAGVLVPLGDLHAWVSAIEGFRDDAVLTLATRAVSARRAALFRYETMVAGFEAVIAEGAS